MNSELCFKCLLPFTFTFRKFKQYLDDGGLMHFKHKFSNLLHIYVLVGERKSVLFIFAVCTVKEHLKILI